jgi:hypothetical protein
MQEFKVTALVTFTVYDEDEYKAIRQAELGMNKWVLGEDAQYFDAEYPEVPRPEFISGQFKVVDSDNKLVFDKLPKEEEEPKDKSAE